MTRLRRSFGYLVVCAGLLVPSTSFAQQSLNISVGGFVPKAERDRDFNDVLVNNLCCLENPLIFDVHDFTGASINAEYLVGLGEFFDGGLGVGYYARNVPSVYLDLVNQNGSEIRQNLRLRTVPFTATIRFLPLGHSNGFEPYLGAGLGVINWRYRESGQWVDPADSSIFTGTYVGKGTATGPVVLGGVRFPAGPWALGFEVKWQQATGDLPADQDFAGSTIDLGGVTYAATFRVRF
jgi:hypothetical protein